MRGLPRNRSRSVRTRSSSFQVLADVLASFTLFLHFIVVFQLESVFDSESVLEAPMSSSAVQQCASARCLHGLHSAQPAATAAASRRIFSITTNLPRCTACAAATVTSPCAGSRLLPFTRTHVRSTLAIARPGCEERLAPGAPNPRHPAAQVP